MVLAYWPGRGAGIEGVVSRGSRRYSGLYRQHGHVRTTARLCRTGILQFRLLPGHAVFSVGQQRGGNTAGHMAFTILVDISGCNRTIDQDKQDGNRQFFPCPAHLRQPPRAHLHTREDARALSERLIRQVCTSPGYRSPQDDLHAHQPGVPDSGEQHAPSRERRTWRIPVHHSIVWISLSQAAFSRSGLR